MSLRARFLTEVKTPREITSRWILENQISTWLSQSGIGRSVMNSDGGVLCKKFKGLLGLVGTEVIVNDVDLTLGGLTFQDLCLAPAVSWAKLSPSPTGF
jgi:hypothetical protein